MSRPNITGMSLKTYLRIRYEQLCARKISIDVYNANYLPEWGEKRYSEAEINQLKKEMKECIFMESCLEEYHNGELELRPVGASGRKYRIERITPNITPCPQ